MSLHEAKTRTFFPGSSEMARRMRDFDWATTAVGSVEQWPQGLQTVVRLLLTSRYPMWLGWGDDLTFFYNDAYSRMTLGGKHPWALGRSARQVWAEIWPDIGPRIESVFRDGVATWDEALLLFLQRSGYREETYHTFSYSPILDEIGGVGGMLCIVAEVTERTIGERRLALLRETAKDLAIAHSEEDVCAALARRLALHNCDLPFALIYIFDPNERQVCLTCASGAAAGSPIAPKTIDLADAETVWPAREILDCGTARTVEDLAARFREVPMGPWDTAAKQARLVPIARQGQERPIGFLVAGLNPYRAFDDAYSGFLDLLAVQVAAALANARTYEERRRAELAEKASAQLAAIVTSSDDAIVGKDLNGIVTSWNRGAERLFGYAADEMIGRSITTIIPLDRLDEEPRILERIRRGERIEHYETIRHRKDGTLLDIALTISPIVDSRGQIVGASKIAHDISERKRAEEALQRQTEALKEADRRKDEFLATLAHELRNPLAPIRNSVSILRLSGGNDAPNAHLYEVMERQVNHMVRLVDDLLEVSRITRGKIELRKERVDLASVVADAMETSRPLLDAGRHRLSLDLPEEPLIVEADPVRLAQVFANLLNNAAKYSEDGGHINIAARPEKEEVVVSVRDNGMGIPAEMLSKVFEMFAQVDRNLKRAGGGLGIGLTLARNLIQQHGGDIEAYSDGPGQGSEFRVRLPLADQSAAAFADGQCGSEVDLSPRRILVVDDNKDVADTLLLLLEAMGLAARAVYDGPSALEAIHAERPAIVLMDVGMPGMDGCETAQRIRQDPQMREVKLVAVTGWGQEEDRRRTHDAGFDHHLVKPVDLRSLQTLFAHLSESAASERGVSH